MRFRSYLPFVALTAFVITALAIPLFPSAEAGTKENEQATFKYVGVAGCKFCHQGKAGYQIYEIWEQTAHAKASEHLDEAAQENDKCLACHTTGFGKAIAAGVTADKLHGVQCEACHGPGSEFKKISIMKDPNAAAAKGLILPSETSCKSCHASDLPKECWAGADRAPGFDFRSAYKKIEHRIPRGSKN
jgi:hypothetical protein